MFFSNKGAAIAWIIVFLGNPGVRFDNTRHNAGFLAADAVEQNTGVRINRLKFKSLNNVAVVGGQRVFLMKPQTYMNLSGSAVRQAMQFYKVPLSNVIAISDDVSLPAGKLRIRRSGSSGGHNGLKDIIEKCGGEGFPRIKIGVGAPEHENYDMKEWVLSKPAGEDKPLITNAALQAGKALEIIITRGVEAAMAEYN